MAVDNIARALASKALAGSGGGGVTPEDLAKKYDKTGGAITGNVSIQGDLTVSGTTTTEKEKQLLVEENVIATNANKVDLKTLLSGLAINKNADATYGIMYDPSDDTVKFGEGTLDENRKFIFKAGEGLPLSIRANNSDFVEAHLVKWDAASKSFVDAGVGVNGLSKAVKSVDFSYGDQTVTYDAAEGIHIFGEMLTTFVDDTTSQTPKEIEIPLAPDDGVVIDAAEDARSVKIGLDQTKTVLLPETPVDGNNIPIYLGSQKTWMTQPVTPSATASSLVSRDANGRFQAGAPENDGDVVIKSALDAAIAEATGRIVSIEGAPGATNGTLTAEQLATLEANENNYIMFDHKKYYPEGNGHQEGYLTYTHVGYENHVHLLESITITISTKAWVLNSTTVYNTVVMSQAAYNALESPDDYTVYLIKG